MTREEIIQGLSIITITNLIPAEKNAIKAAIAILNALPEPLSRRDEMAKSIYHSVRTGVYSMRAWGGAKGSLHEASARETVIATDMLLAELDKGKEVE